MWQSVYCQLATFITRSIKAPVMGVFANGKLNELLPELQHASCSVYQNR